MPQEPESLWDVPELCGRLRVARSTVYDWVSQGFIPHIKLVGSVRFRPSEIATWLDKQAKPGRASRVPEVLV
jgi:excisionase family DNA binding protein